MGEEPPEAETLQVKGLPMVWPEPQSTVTTNGWAATLTVAEAEALAVLASITVKVSIFVPFTGSVLLTEPVPEYGPVPPVAETVQLNGLPAVMPEEGQLTVTIKGWPATLTVAEPEALTPFASVTVKDSVLLPLEASVRLINPIPV